MTVDEFIEKWKPSGGNERANSQLFVSDLCRVLGVGTPQPTRADMAANDYVFERHVVKTEIDGTNSNGWIDCYKRDSFILEAKQGSDADRAAVDAGQGDSLRDFFGQNAAERFKRGMAKRGTGQWIAAMQKAAGQAEGYAKALPKEHGWPPFLLVSDIGHCIDVYPTVPENADFVMFWWDRAASSAARERVRRFGFVSTNSIVQSFSRKVVGRHLGALDAIRLAYAIPDHPWVDESDGAAVRIAMTVGERKAKKDAQGRLLTVIDERNAPEQVAFKEAAGEISSDLRVGAHTGSASALKSNSGLSSVGYQLTGQGFEISHAFSESLSERERHEFVFGLVNASDILRHRYERRVIDACHLPSAQVLMTASPLIYQQLLTHVKPERDVNSRRSVRENWWVYGEARNTYRPATKGLAWQIVTPITSKHRIFCSIPVEFRPDSTCVSFGFDDWFFAGVLSSRFHAVWSLTIGSSLEDRPRYTKAECFDPYAFPDPVADTLKERIRDAAENLDALRKQVLDRHDDLTLTKLYNVLEALRAAEANCSVLSDKDRDVAERGCVSLIRQYHDEIDVAVAEAYGWPTNLSDDEILERLVMLNKERAAEEAKGKVRWLRPEYQAPGYIAPAEQAALALPEEEMPAVQVLEWPAKLPEQVVAVAGIVERAGKPLAANDVARAFKGKRAGTVSPVLDALTGMGRVRKLADGRYAA